MRVMFPVFTFVTLFVLSLEAGTAQQGDEATREKGQAEILKEIGEMRARVRKLASEFASARLVAPGADGFGKVDDPIGVEGSIFPLVAGDEILKGFFVSAGQCGQPVRVSLRKDTKVFYSCEPTADRSVRQVHLPTTHHPR